MHRIEAARFQPGVTASRLPQADEQAAGEKPTERRIRGQALIVWDPRSAGRKRDAIDTDQITPAADCGHAIPTAA